MTRVGIALVIHDGKVLVRRRPAGAPLAGLWEFPGGKCEQGETPVAATERECREETGLGVTAGRLRRVLSHTYPHGRVELYYYDCALHDPLARPRAETRFTWVELARLVSLAFPEANGPVLRDLTGDAATG